MTTHIHGRAYPVASAENFASTLHGRAQLAFRITETPMEAHSYVVRIGCHFTAVHSCHIRYQLSSRPCTATRFALIRDVTSKPWRVFTAVHKSRTRSILFTWELRNNARRKRWFYVNLKRIVTALPSNSWAKVGSSVYLVDERHSSEFREFLKLFEGPDLEWYEFRLR